jgi:hypothetical protein
MGNHPTDAVDWLKAAARLLISDALQPALELAAGEL